MEVYVAVSAILTVIVDVPDPTIVTVLPETVATDVFELENVRSPELFVVGVRLNDGSVAILVKFAKDKEGTTLFTVRVAVVVADVYVAVSAILTVIVDVPAPTIVTLLPETVATLVSELEYVRSPELFVVTEEVRLNDASSVVLVKAANDKEGATLFTVSVAVVVFDVYIAVSAILTVIVDVPAPTIVSKLPEIVDTDGFELVNVNAPELPPLETKGVR